MAGEWFDWIEPPSVNTVLYFDRDNAKAGVFIANRHDVANLHQRLVRVWV